jgi:hypothetical protein
MVLNAAILLAFSCFFLLNVSKEKELFENWVVVIVGRKIGIFVWIIV